MAKPTKVTRSSGNVFADIGLPNADELALKADVAIKLGKMIEAEDLTQGEAAKIIGIAQPDLSKLLRGKLEGFSMDRLLQAIMALGSDIEIRVKKPVRHRRGQGRVLAA